MALPKRYDPKTAEPRWRRHWQEAGTYHFDPQGTAPVYSIDTPPPTVSGFLHLGHCYSYSHTDFIARFYRMNGYNVYYPMGYDDNGLPTERLVERRYGVTVGEVGRESFIEKCLEISAEVACSYQELWQRLGLSIDWRYTYRTIDDLSRRTAQLSFLDLYHRGHIYRQKAPAIWCPECRTAIAQAELNDLERASEFFTLAFSREDGAVLPIATTRPELLPACVAVFVHPDDTRFRRLVGRTVRVPLFGQEVTVMTDPAADPEKGTGAVMCCTFGDATDVEWWRVHELPLVEGLDRAGRLTGAAGEFAGLPAAEGRRRIVAALEAQGQLLGRQPLAQSVRVHERCDTPVEYVVTAQWFVRVLERKEALLAAADGIAWYPEAMRTRYQQWVANLNWDWCISRQRTYGVPFPVWYCDTCGKPVLAVPEQLPVEPLTMRPAGPCPCGGTSFHPEEDVMDTWATSSLTPQIAGQWLADPALYEKVFPFSLRPQAHEIIRTWAFYTIVKSLYHWDTLPWKDVAISGWGLAPEGTGKISKSRGGGPMPPLEMLSAYSADAVRYWAASAGPGKDSIISEEKIQAGARLVTKLWNVARFSERFLAAYEPPAEPPVLSPADRWILARTQRLVRQATGLFHGYDYAAAKSEVENFFWGDLADNYLEMAKLRLYNEDSAGHEGARYALYHVLVAVVKMLAPILPYVTEEVYQGLFARPDEGSLHRAAWPAVDVRFDDPAAEAHGDILVCIATAARRYKSERSLSLGSELPCLHLATEDQGLAAMLRQAREDLVSVTRAREIEIGASLDLDLEPLVMDGRVGGGVVRGM
jgi:valyl-tRNA synthetase